MALLVVVNDCSSEAPKSVDFVDVVVNVVVVALHVIGHIIFSCGQ